MAEVETDDPERKAAVEAPKGRGVALADETPDELPALLAIAVGVAILAITIVWPSIRDRTDLTVEAKEPVAEVVEEAEEEPVEEEVEAPAGPNLPEITAGLEGEGLAGLALGADGNVVTVTGEVADEAARDQVLAFVGGQVNVDEVVDEMTIAAPAAADGTDVTVTAAQVSIVLKGSVPDEATREAIVSRAVGVYSEAQVDDQLVVDPAVTPPATITIEGAMTDEVLFNQVLAAFDDLEGVEVAETTIVLEESGQLESDLNTLEPIQFESGSALVEPASEPILDEAANFLKANPEVSIEIGGHTDSIGTPESNQTLSAARAESVRAALEAREVTNEMTAVGFGERRLKEPNDEADAEAQRTNRRIEFRITN